ncbi:hypothetical protein GCM10022392_16160 [Mucilaginibacter panaciglaebae]|uniref:Outer membrane protein with beta-barrel domain n=1 Tax=Mucilaginibacter panaciglaebae TaxID=502331 RepID=A0ABP7WQG6_9SPHI
MILRKLILCITLIFAEAGAYAQDSYNFSNWGLGVFGGVNYPFADLKKANQGKSFDVVAYYNLTPYVPLGFEIQTGQLSGGSIITDPSTRQYNNQYTAVFVHGDYSLGEAIDYEGSFLGAILKDLYGGIGVGVIVNHMKFIQRYDARGYRFPGNDNSLNIGVPLRFGYEFKIYNTYGEPFIGLNIQYVHNVTFSEGLDGYADPSSKFKNNSPDQYRQIQVGLKVNFGPAVPYTKKINY